MFHADYQALQNCAESQWLLAALILYINKLKPVTDTLHGPQCVIVEFYWL